MAPFLLHGILRATIFEIDRLQITGSCGFLCGNGWNPEKMTKKFLSQLKRAVLCRPEIAGSRLYATIDLERARVARTRMVEYEPSHPRWYEGFRVYCAHVVSNLIFTVKDDNPIGATLIGRAYLPVEEIRNGFTVDRWLRILDEDGNQIPGGSKIHVKLQFFSVNQDGNWSQGIRSSLAFKGVPFCFFKERQGCSVTLYQDAHMPDDAFTNYLESKMHYEPQRCWEDVFDAINNARNIIYIAGWSVNAKITLIRDPNRPKHGGNVTLGEVLKNKANEGVRVLLLVWDDRTSVETLKKDGLMATHDQETWEFFRNTNVHCILCPRNPDDGNSIFQGFQVSTMFTHHQKTIIVDSEIPGGTGESSSGMRRIVCFLGGIDLCDGRYDSMEHPLFRSLNTIHKDDFHQPNFPGSSITKGGPREPWHDIHCRIEGPAAWDVLYNFEQRWQKQVGNNLLYTIGELDRFIIRPSPTTSSDDPETWNVQIFRSIDGGAANGFPESPEEAAEVGLVSGKDHIIDRSIQDAYINAIRRAKNFIYIENQYFLGSSFGWEANDIRVDDINALHLIPKELSLKIVSKIETGERFTVYIVIPMWPEGIPESGSVQAILDWQRRTMEMMYKDIARALHAKGQTNADLRDYLTFFCLGNREPKVVGEYVPPQAPDPNTDYARAQQSRRFMIYVHAKTMIVDDEYIIVGSANINQRSMDGGRDSEIAMGCYQPHHLAGSEVAVRGQVFRFRMALWLEHLGLYNAVFFHPEMLECVRAVNSIADKNWENYSSDAFPENEYLPGHLLKYPVNVSSNGAIAALPGFDFFPDTKAHVLGTRSDYLPPNLTT